MNERIKQLWSQAEEEIKAEYEDEKRRNRRLYNEIFLPKFAELIVAEAFRAGMLYSAKKYADEGSEYFTGNDVAMFLEMEACELSDEDIKQHFGVEE